ncbi:arginine deiminase family protein [soil metagenome]
MLVALTHVPSPHMQAGLRTYLARTEIDPELARKQHVALRRLLSRRGALVRTLDDNRTLPDCAFVEDTAVVLDEVAILSPMGAPQRQHELPVLLKELQKYREVERLEAPAKLEGGDVLRIGRKLLVGISSRTDVAGFKGLREIVQRFGYETSAIPVRGSLHLKTACTALDDHTLLINPVWLDTTLLGGFELVPVPEQEPWAANVLPIGGAICLSSAHPRTAERIQQRGLVVETIDLSEFAKAEAGITCLSLLFEYNGLKS